MQAREYLFLYGTLLTGTPSRRLDQLVTRCCAVGKPAYVHGRLYDLGSYPGAVPSIHKHDLVFGQLCQLANADACLRVLDRYELYIPGDEPNSEYLRRRVDAFLIPSGRRVNSWIYFYNRSTHDKPQIHTGDYLLHAQGGKH